jgi:branched-chain amino acid transport system ATP-binding protein
MALLEIDDLKVSYGAVAAVQGISLRVEEGQIVTLLGANGVGKTTTLRAISGLAKGIGAIRWAGESILGWAPHRIVAAGIAHVPEGRGIFPNLSVEENLDLGSYIRKDRSELAADWAHVFELFPRLKERIKQKAGTLSGGEQQMLAIGRALLGRPRLLLLDEPSLGLAPLLVRTIFQIIREINARGTTILLVEQNAHMALQAAHYGYVLAAGRIVMQDAAQTLAASNDIKGAYLGKH